MISNFNLYNEPVEFQWLVFFFNTFVYFGLWFAALHVIRLALFDKAKLILSGWTILAIASIATLFNIYLGIYIEIWGFIFLYVLAAWLSWRWIDRKSLRWTNISLALFFLFTLGFYNLFNTKVQSITYSFFSTNDIVEYSFNFKDYFQIYLPGQTLANTKIFIDGKWLEQGDDALYYRIYFFYYFMQSLAISFWMLVFFDVLKKHMFFYGKQAEKLKEYMFFYAPEDFKWSSFKIKTPREIYLSEKKEQKKKLKSGELIKAIIPKPMKQNIKTSDVLNITETVTKENFGKDEFEKNIDNIKIQNNKDSVIDKKLKETMVIEENKDLDMNNEKVKAQLYLQAKELEKKANELKQMADSLDSNYSQSEKSELNILKDKVDKLHKDLIDNPVFKSIKNIHHLRTFMEWHVFAVWDFMSLTKRLQIDLTCVKLPWMPPENSKAAHLINSIVLGEETDKTTVKGERASHFELYLKAMEEIGASTVQIRNFLDYIKAGLSVSDALDKCKAPEAAKKFTNGTIDTAINGSTAQALGSFFFGRENVIPEMFDALLKDWQIDKNKAPTFVYYLERHIELDKDDHGPAAMAMMNSLFPEDEDKIKIYKSAIQAIESRIYLWNNLYNEIN